MRNRLYIPEYFSEDIIGEIDFQRASFYFTHWGDRNGKSEGMLDKLIAFEEWYDLTIRQINGNVHPRYDMEDDFYEEWRYEICYFNVLFEGFSQLFAPAKEAA